jgi:hypothetical protein
MVAINLFDSVLNDNKRLSNSLSGTLNLFSFEDKVKIQSSIALKSKRAI